MGIQVWDTIGDYQVIGVLGTGGMGKVFRVRNVISDREEAMKVVLSAVGAEGELAERFLREIKVHASLTHPNIATLHTAIRAGDQILMIMELVEGCSLAERLAQGSMDLRQGIGCIEQVLSALAFAHARGVIHRDVKPANIILSAAGIVKLMDFGIARATGQREITSTGMALGSLYYMSPEQVRAGPVDGRSDLYSVGVTLYEIVTGRRPFTGDSEYALMNAQLTQVPVAPDELVPGLPAPLSAAILKSLAKDPAERFQTADEFRAALEGTGDVPAVSSRALDTAQLAVIEARLAEVVGPIAKNLVASAIRRYATMPEICRNLAERIADPSQREAFLRSSLKESSAARSAVSAAVVSPAAAEAAERSLAGYIGPIARVVAQRAARKARSAEEFYQALAAQIPGERERRAFLGSVGR